MNSPEAIVTIICLFFLVLTFVLVFVRVVFLFKRVSAIERTLREMQHDRADLSEDYWKSKLRKRLSQLEREVEGVRSSRLASTQQQQLPQESMIRRIFTGTTS